MIEFHHPPTPPPVPNGAVLIVAPTPPRTRRVQRNLAMSYPDAPGALRAAEDAMEEALRVDLTALLGEAATADALRLVAWEVQLHHGLAGRSVLRARLDVTIQQAA